MKPSKAETRPPLTGGCRLLLHPGGLVGRFPVAVTVQEFQPGLIEVKGASGSLNEGETVLVEYRIDDDARYLARGIVEDKRPEGTSISGIGEWRRVQDRSFVRISTHGLEVELQQSGGGDTHRPLRKRFAMLDVSAGGIRFESREAHPIDEQFVCHFELPGQLCYVLPVRVVRCVHQPGSRTRYQVAVEFLELGEAHRSQLLQWIYREQARRHRTAKRARR